MGQVSHIVWVAVSDFDNPPVHNVAADLIETLNPDCQCLASNATCRHVIVLRSGGDRRSIGRVPEVVALVEQQPVHFHALIGAMEHPDPIIRMRAADAVEKITARHPSYLHPYTQRLINHIAVSQQQEARWHIAQIAPRLPLTPAERAQIIDVVVKEIQRLLQDNEWRHIPRVSQGPCTLNFRMSAASLAALGQAGASRYVPLPRSHAGE